MVKEKTEPIDVGVRLKSFLNIKKVELKDENNSFYTIDDTLMYYLTSSKVFLDDFSEFIGAPIVVGDTDKILNYYGDDLLLLLTKLS